MSSVSQLKYNKSTNNLTYITLFCLCQFCEFMSVSWLTDLVGTVVRMLLDYVSHVSICSNLIRILERRPEWDEISEILSKTTNLLWI